MLFTGKFRLAYLSVKMLACYAGVFMLCYYWPLFLNALLGDKSQPFGILAGAGLLPLGFLILGGLFGMRVALAHAVTALVAAGFMYGIYVQLPGADLNERAEALLGAWIWVSIGMYVVGAACGLKAQLVSHAPDADATAIAVYPGVRGRGSAFDDVAVADADEAKRGP